LIGASDRHPARFKKWRAGRWPAHPLQVRVGAGERIPQARIFELELLQLTSLDVTCGTILRLPRAKRRTADAVVPAKVHDRRPRCGLA